MAITWALNKQNATASCSTGTETFAAAATDGLPLSGLVSINLFAEAPQGQTIASGTLQCYILNDITGNWARAPGYDVSISATALRSYYFSVLSPGVGSPVLARRGRIAWVPNSVTAAMGLTVYLNGMNERMTP